MGHKMEEGFEEVWNSGEEVVCNSTGWQCRVGLEDATERRLEEV